MWKNADQKELLIRITYIVKSLNPLKSKIKFELTGFYIIAILAFNELHAILSCVKRIDIRIFSCPYFPAFELNTERYSVSLRIQSKYGKIQTTNTPNTDTFHTVL